MYIITVFDWIELELAAAAVCEYLCVLPLIPFLSEFCFLVVPQNSMVNFESSCFCLRFQFSL